MNPKPNFLNIPASPFDLNAQSSNIIPIASAANQLPSAQFDPLSGWLDLVGDAKDNIVKQTITDRGYYQFEIDGNIFSGDRTSSSFWQGLDGATSENVVGINFDGGLGNDTLIVSNQNHHKSFSILADDTIQIQGEIQTESLFIKARDIFNQGVISANSLTAEFNNSYTDTADAQIIAGNILLNGATGNLQAKGQFLATGTTGGKIDFRAATISLNSANLDASGENGGGTILIGGDYQGVDSGNLANAQSTFADKYSTIKANANQTGNGGKVIIWADGDTDFRGNINARGGEVAGDGGFAEISGKQNLNFVGKVDLDASNGNKGNILLDPTDIIINADDRNPATFDISDLYKLNGNINLSATNSIVFNTEVADFPDSNGTITLEAGGVVSLFGYFYTNGRNLNIAAGSINHTGPFTAYIYANSRFGSTSIAGNVRLTSQREIDLGYIQSAGGNITLEAGTSITASGGIFSQAYSQGNSGDIKVSAEGNISLDYIISDAGITSDAEGCNAGNVKVVSTSGNIEVIGLIASRGIYGNSESITLNGYGSVLTRYITTKSETQDNSSSVDGFRNAGTVRITSETGKIDTQGNPIYTSAYNGNAGDVILNAYSDIVTNYIHADAFKAGNGGSVELTSQTGKIYTIYTNVEPQKGRPPEDPNLVKDAFGNIETGNITTTSVNGVAGDVKLEAAGDIETGAIKSNVFAGSGNGGNISLTTYNGNITSDYLRSDSVGGESGNISVDASKGLVKVTGEFDIEGRPISIYSGAYQKGSITIKHGGGSQFIAFKVGDSSVNGTLAEIQGQEGIATKSIFPESFSWEKISIMTDPSPLLAAFASISDSYYLGSTFGVNIPTSIPSGVSIDKNIKEAIDNKFTLFGLPIWNPFWFFNKVKGGADWDYKKFNPDFQDFGNFHYGATGRAFGFAEKTLLQEAGLYQVEIGQSKPEWGSPGSRGNSFDLGTAPYGDDPNDQYWIKEGVKYHDLIYAPRQADAFNRQFEVYPTDYKFRLF